MLLPPTIPPLHPHHRLSPTSLQDSVPSSSELPFLLPSYFMKKTKAINSPHLSPYKCVWVSTPHFPPSRPLLAHLTHITWSTSCLSPPFSAWKHQLPLVFKGPPSALDFPSRSHPVSHFSFTVRHLRIVTPAHYLHFLISCSLLNPLQSGFSSHNSAISAHHGLQFRPNHLAPGHPGSLSDFDFCSTVSGTLPPHSSLPHHRLLVGLPSLCILHGCCLLPIICM